MGRRVFMKIISWNVNGIKSLVKGGFFNEIFKEDADIICLQELRTHDEIPTVEGYACYRYFSAKKGSGVAVYTKEEAINVKYGMGIEKFDEEGRVLRLGFNDFNLFNFYAPSGSKKERLQYKFEFYEIFTEYVCKSDKPAVICGDFNRIHSEIDAKRPELIKNKSGFLPEEEQWFKEITKSKYIDAFRIFHKDGENYTWWPYSRNARKLNNGLRLDYFLVDSSFKDTLTDSYILSQQQGSDHAPIVLELNSCPACGKLLAMTDDFCSECGLKLIDNTEESMDKKTANKLRIPEDKIILLDLNYTLISNSRESFGRYPNRIYMQEYEEKLIELIKNNYVILITARPYKYSYKTLEHIKKTTGFDVDEHYWNFGLQPHELKKYWMENEIFNKHGRDSGKYLAIESNPRTRSMYKKLGIEAHPKQDFI